MSELEIARPANLDYSKNDEIPELPFDLKDDDLRILSLPLEKKDAFSDEEESFEIDIQEKIDELEDFSVLNSKDLEKCLINEESGLEDLQGMTLEWIELSEEITQLSNLSPNDESCSDSGGGSIEEDLLHVAFDLLDGSSEINQLEFNDEDIFRSISEIFSTDENSETNEAQPEPQIKNIQDTQTPAGLRSNSMPDEDYDLITLRMILENESDESAELVGEYNPIVSVSTSKSPEHITTVKDINSTPSENHDTEGNVVPELNSSPQRNSSKKTNVNIRDEEEHQPAKPKKKLSSSVTLNKHGKNLHPDRSQQPEAVTCSKPFQSLKSKKSTISQKKISNKPNAHSHRSEIGNRCKLCNEYFQNGLSWLQHMLLVHRKKLQEKPTSDFYCGICGISKRDRNTMKKHLENHQKPYRCACGKVFTEDNKFIEHSISHKTRSKVLKCRRCDREFTDSVSIVRHIRFHMDQKIAAVERDKPAPEKPNRDMTLKCRQCGDTFKSKLTFIKHLKSHNSNVLASDNRSAYTCYLCHKEHTTYVTFVTHLKLHEGKEQRVLYPCKYCDKCVPYPSLKEHFKDHIRKEITAKNKFQCKHCSKLYTEKEAFAKHLEGHKISDSTQCSICGKTFSDNLTLILHSHLHMAEKKVSTGLYQCGQCQRHFDNNPAYLSHLKEHTNKTKKIKCKLCEKVVPGKLEFAKHLKEHSAAEKGKVAGEKQERHDAKSLLRCKECLMSFKNYVTFNKHIQSHRKTKPMKEEAHTEELQNKQEMLKEVDIFKKEAKKYECGVGISGTVLLHCEEPKNKSVLVTEADVTSKMDSVGSSKKRGCETLNDIARKRQHKRENESIPVSSKVSNRVKNIEQRSTTKLLKDKGSEKSMKCPYCNCVFQSSKLFTIHFKSHAVGTYRRVAS